VFLTDSPCRVGVSKIISLPLRNTEHPLPTTAAGPQRLTPTRRHPCCTKKKGRARRRTAPTDVAHSWATQARPRRRAWARGTVQRHVDRCNSHTHPRASQRLDQRGHTHPTGPPPQRAVTHPSGPLHHCGGAGGTAGHTLFIGLSGRPRG